MKIKCRKCGKGFDPDIYSGICPRCGAYSGFCAEGDSHYAEATAETGGEKKTGSLAVKALCFLLALIPVITVFFYQAMKKEAIQERINPRIAQISPENGNTLVFDQEMFRYPVTVSVLGQERKAPGEFAEEEKALLVIRASAVSGGYNADAQIENVFLEYRYDGRDFYQKPMDFYSMSGINSWPFGMTDSELLPADSYGFGNGEPEEGYWFFGIPGDAENPVLIVEAGIGEGIIFSQGMISLENVPEMSVLRLGEEKE